MTKTEKQILASLVEGRLNKVFKETVTVDTSAGGSALIAETATHQASVIAPELHRALSANEESMLELADKMAIKLGKELMEDILEAA